MKYSETFDRGADTTSGSRASVRTVVIDYTNWRGEHGERRVIPQRIWFGSTEWHPEPQWLLDAFDIERGANRSFTMAEIRAWRPSARDVRAG